MKLAVLLASLLLLAACSAAPRPQPLLLTFADGTCSGTAIARHVVLTATHCFDDGAKLDARHVLKRIDDGADHTLLIVSDAFDAGAVIAAMPGRGDQVYIVGNPGDLRGLYAEGTVAGRHQDNILLNLPIFYGDSGAAVFDHAGRIVGVVSGIRVLAGGGALLQWGEVRPFRFTPSQWREAGLGGMAAD